MCETAASRTAYCAPDLSSSKDVSAQTEDVMIFMIVICDYLYFKPIILLTLCGAFAAIVICLTFVVSFCLKQPEPTVMALSCLEAIYTSPKFNFLN